MSSYIGYTPWKKLKKLFIITKGIIGEFGLKYFFYVVNLELKKQGFSIFTPDEKPVPLYSEKNFQEKYQLFLNKMNEEQSKTNYDLIYSPNLLFVLFANSKNFKAVGEASPTYLWDPKAPQLIHECVPNAKIIMILRDPIKRSFSHYLNGIGLGYENMSYIDSMKKASKNKNDYSGRIYTTSFYTESVLRYQEIFDKKNIKILIFEEFFKNIEINFEGILNFLNVSGKLNMINFKSHNEFSVPRGKFSQMLINNKKLRSIVRNFIPAEKGNMIRSVMTKNIKKPKMTSDEFEFAKNIYFNDVRNLESLLGRSLPWSI